MSATVLENRFISVHLLKRFIRCSFPKNSLSISFLKDEYAVFSGFGAKEMLPAGFEPAAFHLGGERSILLSYGSLIILDFGFWIAECQTIRC